MEHKEWNWFLNYTLSKSIRSYKEIQNGGWFNSPFDRRHDISFALNWKRDKRWEFGFLWEYYTGNRISIPTSGFNDPLTGVRVFSYSTPNNFKLRDYHRLDISATLHSKPNSRNRANTWNFSIYNAYNRKNPFYIDIESFGFPQSSFKLYERSIFPLFPSVGFSRNF